MIQLNHFSKKIEFIATGTDISMKGKVTKSVYCRFSSIWLKNTDSVFKKSSFGSQNKIPIFNRKIRNLMISRSLLSQSIHRLIKHYSILVIIQMSQYSTYWRVKIGDWPILTLRWVETVTVFWQILCFGELINRFWKSSPYLDRSLTSWVNLKSRFVLVSLQMKEICTLYLKQTW